MNILMLAVRDMMLGQIMRVERRNKQRVFLTVEAVFNIGISGRPSSEFFATVTSSSWWHPIFLGLRYVDL
jgi:hypothetical protein